MKYGRFEFPDNTASEFTHQSGQLKLMFIDSGYAQEIAILNDGELEHDDDTGSEQD